MVAGAVSIPSGPSSLRSSVEASGSSSRSSSDVSEGTLDDELSAIQDAVACEPGQARTHRDFMSMSMGRFATRASPPFAGSIPAPPVHAHSQTQMLPQLPMPQLARPALQASKKNLFALEEEVDAEDDDSDMGVAGDDDAVVTVVPQPQYFARSQSMPYLDVSQPMMGAPPAPVPSLAVGSLLSSRPT